MLGRTNSNQQEASDPQGTVRSPADLRPELPERVSPPERHSTRERRPPETFTYYGRGLPMWQNTQGQVNPLQANHCTSHVPEESVDTIVTPQPFVYPPTRTQWQCTSSCLPSRTMVTSTLSPGTKLLLISTHGNVTDCQVEHAAVHIDAGGKGTDIIADVMLFERLGNILFKMQLLKADMNIE